MFHALADPSRRDMVPRLARRPAPVSELARPYGMSMSAVVQHLKVLEGSGLVAYHVEGTRHLYALAPEGYVEAQRWFVETWDSVLDAFAAHLAQEEK